MTREERTFLVDGLQVSNFFGSAQLDYQAYFPQRELFEHWRAAKLDCVHVTCVIWEDARQGLDAIARWNRAAREFCDLFTLARHADDVIAAQAAGKTAVILGMQNTSPFEDDLQLVEIFHQLGIRFAQPTYNIQNFVGSSCYEPNDSGLTRFGRFVIREMNRLGMAIDLSHVGDRTSLDAIELSTRPVAVTHAMPRWVYDHLRNKSDAVIKEVGRTGGMFGLSIYPALMGGQMTLCEFCSIVARLVDQIGVDHVGIGSDMALGWNTNDAFTMSMGRWTHAPDYGAHTSAEPGWTELPTWFRNPSHFPQLVAGLHAHGFAPVDVQKITGGNWMRFLRAAL
jgi:membrane dipeptidase